MLHNSLHLQLQYIISILAYDLKKSFVASHVGKVQQKKLYMNTYENYMNSTLYISERRKRPC